MIASVAATNRSRIGNLPRALTSFVGRRPQLAEVTTLLDSARLVSLIGPPGVGKTRLALEAAASRRRTSLDGAWLAEFGSLRDPTLLADVVMAVLGVREQAGKPPMTTLSEFLSGRDLLLVLDNCEHLVDACARLAGLLLRECPALRILATSREPLGIPGEALLLLPPLEAADPADGVPAAALVHSEAVALFIDRARAASPDFEVDDHNYLAVAAICHRLEGLPLAIELAASRLRALSAQQILDRLGDRYRIASRGPRTGPTRQQTLRACIAWSFDLCTTAERTLWARLAVLAGSFEIDAAEGICAGDGTAGHDTIEVVGRLADKSIIVADTDGRATRYRLLETVREYGLEQLRQAGEAVALRRRHRDWYLQLLLRAEADRISDRQPAWQDRLTREMPNIRAAMEFCLTEPGEAEPGLRIALALNAYWTRGGLREGRQWLERALARQNGPPTPLWARAVYQAALLAGFQGDVPGTVALLDRAHRIADRLGDRESRALAIQAEGNMSMFTGSVSHAATCYEQVLDQHRTDGNLSRLLEALSALAFASGLLGNWPRATSCHEETLAITEPRGEVWYRSDSLYGLGFATWRQGDPGQAVDLLRQSLRLKLLVDDPPNPAFAIEALAWIATSRGDHHRAAVLLGAADAATQGGSSPTATFPDLLEYHLHCEQQTRQALGNDRFQDAYDHGSKGLTFADAVAYALQDTSPPSTAAVRSPLSRRQHQIAVLVAEGLTNKDIAAQLVISQRTVEGHVHSILTKLGLTNRVQLAVWIAGQPPWTEHCREPS